jgi:nucleoside-diphosphate-sugar epimerase
MHGDRHGDRHEDARVRETFFPRRGDASRPEDNLWSYDKLLVERAARAAPDLPATVLRLPAVFGPGDERWHRVGRYLAYIDSCRSDMALDAALSMWRWTRGYVEDVGEAVAMATVDAAASGHTYNVGEADPQTEGDRVRAIARIARHAGRVVETRHDDLPAEIRRDLAARNFAHDVVLDTSRIRADLGWRPRVPSDDALAASVGWERRRRSAARIPAGTP